MKRTIIWPLTGFVSVNVFLYLVFAFCAWDFGWPATMGEWRVGGRLGAIIIYLLVVFFVLLGCTCEAYSVDDKERKRK